MSEWIANPQQFYRRLEEVRERLEDRIFQPMVNEVSGVLARFANQEGIVEPGALVEVLNEADEITDRYLVGGFGRNVYRESELPEGVFTEILQESLTEVNYDVLDRHVQYIRRNASGELVSWFTQWEPQGDHRAISVYGGRARFVPNPFADYEAPHEWVDPNGYRLSDRIWKTSERTRKRLDAFLTDRIKSGQGAYSMSKELEQFLLPSREGIKTWKPYGKKASFDAMRLARTEITRAHSQASAVMAQLNPYVEGIDFCLSASHPEVDICDGLASIGMSGNRLKEPYDKRGGYPLPVVSTHPHCLCHVRPINLTDPAVITGAIREALQDRPENPPFNPLAVEYILGTLLGGIASVYIERVLPKFNIYRALG